MKMLCEARSASSLEVIDGFRQRGMEVSRLESFSDTVFGFALTLLIVSLDVPKTFNDLIATMRGFPAFALCFLLLAIIWNSHYRFSRRYGLEDGTTRTLTFVLLFLVLFYVYPLKFLFNFTSLFIVRMSSGGEIALGQSNAVPMTRAQASILLVIYGLGFAAVYLALALLYLHAWRLRDTLDLNELERLDTRHSLWRLSFLIGVGLAAATLAAFRSTVNYSDLCYLLIFPILRLHSFIHRRCRKVFLAGQVT